MLSDNHFVGFAANTARIIKLRLPGRNLHLTEKPEQRVWTESDGYGKRLSSVEILLPVNVAMMARRHIERERVLVMHHDTVATEIDPTFVGIAADNDIERADVTAAITLVPERRR